MKHELEQRFYANDFDAREELGFGEIVKGDVDLSKIGGFGSFNDIDDTADGADLAVKREFADEKLLAEVRDEEIAGEDENSQSDW